MIVQLLNDLKAQLRTRACSVPLVLGPEQTRTTTNGRERIVLEHGEGDSFQPMPTAQKNPTVAMVRMAAMKITVYAQSTLAGAADFEHRRRAEAIVDTVLASLSAVWTERKGRGSFLPSSGTFTVPEDLEASERRGGAVYELGFAWPRAVFDAAFDGSPAPEAGLSSDPDVGPVVVTTTRTVAVNGGDAESF